MRKPESDFLKQLMARPDRTEALAWLDGGQGKNNLGELTAEESLRIVHDLYHWGAVEVFAVKIDAQEGFGTTDNLIIGMNDNPDSREKIFLWLNQLAEKMGLEPEEDERQRYVLAWFD